ncbi:unnamed protein product [Lupinus luteus]|uniref:Leucine-rich repeat-containing N-terminal plant-type domain-containing protein n=1 Tax=Lupinus luteus TaxID=3873 RepID=A0AAV1WCN4_LUPLU
MGLWLTLLSWNMGLLVIVLVSDGAIGCLEAEKVALLELKYVLNSLNGTILPSWNDDQSDCCEWERVICGNTTKTKQVTQLLLNNLRDSELINPYWSLNASYLIPFLQLQVLDLSWNYITELSTLSKLEVLDLGNNLLTGSLPESIGNLSTLKALSLSMNNLAEPLPSEGGICKLKKLQDLDLDHNKLPGQLPFCLKNLTSLRNDIRVIDLSYNGILDRFPNWLLKNNTRLEFFGLGNNYLTGPLELNCTSRYIDMNTLDVSHNPIKRDIPPCIGFVYPNLRVLNMSKSALEGIIPASMGDMGLLMILDLSANNLFGQIPKELVIGGKSLEFLKLSNNNFSGPILSTKANLGLLRVLRLDNNHFTGKISDVFMNSSLLRVLDLSNNHLNGELPGWIGSYQQLTSLVLSQNSLQGVLPLELCKLNRLTYLDLSKNNFTGTLPSCFDLLNLRYLHLQGNQFSGPMPIALANSSLLLTFDLMNNRFSGEIPSWIGTFSNLRVLLLKGNYLKGSIPIAICQLRHISILDLSHNNLSGNIPSCLNVVSSGLLDPLDNILFGEYFIMVPIKFPKYLSDNLIHVDEGIDIRGLVSDEEQDVEFMSKRRSESYKGNILYYMSGIDISCNMLTGPIPPQIGYLNSIHTLNLSNNNLSGSIPESFSNLRDVESLDISYNKLSGHIPSQLIELYSLALFSVAHNNLSGMTPESKYQFATFGPSSYEGNPLLCGPPLQGCTFGTATEPVIHSDVEEESNFKDNFLWSFAASFVIAFLSVIVICYFNPDLGSRTFPCMFFV